MPSSRPVTFWQAVLWFLLLLVLFGLFIGAVASGMPWHLIVLVCLGLSRYFRAADEDEEPEPVRPPLRSSRSAPLRPPMVDRDYPLFDRELDGSSLLGVLPQGPRPCTSGISCPPPH